MRTFIVLAVLAPALAVAQVPRKLGYQGRLLNADGTPAQGTVQLRFDLFAATTGGASLWSETQTIVLSDGLYSTFLGEVTPLPDTVFDGSERYLELTVGGAALSPRQRVASVPYALVARDPRLLASCADGEVLKWSAANGRWGCASDDSVGGSTLANYVTNASLATTLASYATTADLGGYVTNASLSTTLASYPTTASLTTTLGGYVTNAALGTTLASYATTQSVSSALSGYVTSSSLTSTLSGYVTSASLGSTLSGYATTASIPTSVNGLGGGAISSGVTVAGPVAATTLTQGGNAVCDTSGNCGTTLGAFSPSGCTTGQVLQWTGTGWQCAAAGGAPPSQPCTGAGQALQWNGTAWLCVDLRNSGASGGQANGFEVRDDWGDTWDGVPRSAKTWSEANLACLADGARLPTVTELWRNRASHGTGNIGGPNDTQQLWTIAPSYRPLYFMTTALATSAFSEALGTATYPYRCIWKAAQPAGFTGTRCYGPVGAECGARDPFHNVDRWSRAPQYFTSARHECELEGASVATAEDYAAQISSGANFVSSPDLPWPVFQWTSSASYHGNGYLSVLRWSRNPEPWWGPDSSSASHAGPSSVYPFRCVGKKVPTSGVQPPSPACQGSCFQTSAGRNRLTADGTDRAAAVWHAALKTCLGLGATLPSTEELNQLVHAGWQNGTNNYLWSSSPATWGWQVYRWAGTGSPYWNPHYDYAAAAYSGALSAPTAARPYRCVWRETEASAFVSCAANQVQLRDPATGAFSCVNTAAGNSNGNQNPSGLPPFVDAWGNAWDVFERPAASFPTARATCESAGGRLPMATELYRVRYNNGVVGNELGQASSTAYAWTLNPDYREGFRTTARLSDGATTGQPETASFAYRCVWPATAPTAFSGHACYGSPATPCFETGRLRADQHPRAALPQPAAQWECRQLGGRLPSVRELAQLQQAGLANAAATTAEWSREWAYWTDGNTYVFAPRRGIGVQANWQLDQAANEIGWDNRSTPQRFRCVFTDVME